MRGGWKLRRLAGGACLAGCLGGCIDWGEASFEVRAPSERTRPAPEEEVVVAATVLLPSVPAGTLLLAGERDGERARLGVVGVWREGSLQAVPGESSTPGISAALGQGPLAVGSEWVLFAGGDRVGEFVVDSVARGTGACSSEWPEVFGDPLLTREAQAATRLLALPRDRARDRAFGRRPPANHVYDERVASLNLASAVVTREAAAWPPDGFLAIREEITAFSVQDGTRFFAATFALADEMAVGPPADPNASAYSIFLMASRRANGDFFPVYSHYRDNARGKAVPGYFGHLDIDGDGADELLLKVYGEADAWWALLERRGNLWHRVFEEPCRAPVD